MIALPSSQLDGSPSHRLLREPVMGRIAVLLLVLGSGAMLALLIFVGRWLTFWYDEWSWILHRRDPWVEVLLAPYVDHLSTVPLLIYQGLFRTVGLTSYFPYLGIAWALHFASVALLFAVARRRAGPLIGLAAGVSLLFLGSAYENLLQPFQMSFLLATAFGLLAVERLHTPAPSRGQSATAAAALVVAVASSSVGVLFTGMVLFWALLERDWRRLMAAVPAFAVYSVWYLTWGRSGAGLAGTSDADLALVPAKLIYGLGASLSGVAGLPPERFAWLGLGLGVGLAVVAVFLHRRGARFTSLACAALVALLAEYGLQAIFRARFGLEQSTRSAYLYPAAIFIWLAAVEFAGPLRRELPRRLPVLFGLAVILALMIVGNMTQFVGAARAMRDLRQTEIAELRLLESMQSSPALDRSAVPDPDLMPQVVAGLYLEAVSILGEPHLAIPEPSLDEPRAVDPVRLDRALVRLLGDSFDIFEPSSFVAPRHPTLIGATALGGGSCLNVEGDGDGGSVAWQPSGDGVSVRARGGSGPDIHLGAFGEPSQLLDPSVGTQPDGSRGIALPPLPSELRWTVLVSIEDNRTVEICDARG